MSADAFRRAYADDRIGRPWGFKSTDYAGGYHRGLDVRERNKAGTASIVTDVVAISDGVVDYVGRPNDLLGPTVRIKRDDGGYEFHSHTIASVKVGTGTTTGTVLGRNARLTEKPGLIDGVHDHIVFSDHSDGAWRTSRATHDPLLFIRSALAALAGGDAKPFPIPEEDTLSAAEVAEIKAHVTAEAKASRAGTPGNGAKLTQYRKSSATGDIFALYENSAGRRFRVRVTDPLDTPALRDAAVMPQVELWGYEEWFGDRVAVRPGAFIQNAQSDKTESFYALFCDDNGNLTRKLLQGRPDGEVPVMAQAKLWTYAPTNQPL